MNALVAHPDTAHIISEDGIGHIRLLTDENTHPWWAVHLCISNYISPVHLAFCITAITVSIKMRLYHKYGCKC